MDAEYTILVADDEEPSTDAIAYALGRENYHVVVAYDGEEALKKIELHTPDVVILDIMMLKYTGYDVCRNMSQQAHTGIIMLTAKGNLVDKVLGLELGADDYMTKPFDMTELLARVRSLCRRIQKGKLENQEKVENESQIVVGELMVYSRTRQVFIDHQLIEFKPKEFDLLFFLLKNRQQVFSRESILNQVWDMDYLGGTRTIDIHIQRIRYKLGTYGSLIQTVSKVGYKAGNYCHEK
jgi:DNA-binding response OmpR family regulator